MKKHHFLALVVLGFGILLFFFKLGSLPLLDPDEPRYARSAYEMKESGDWINPQLNGENRWDKPILFYWLILWSYWIFGISEWSSRFPSALFAVLNLLLVFVWACRNRHSSVGWRAALILGTNIEFFAIGRLAITDMTLCFFESLALVIAFESWRSGQGKHIILAYVACALAVLTKGPIGLLLPALTFFIFLILTKNIFFLKKARVGTGLIIFLILALPWYIIEIFLYKDFFQYFFVLHNIKRYATESLKDAEPIFYHFGVLLLGFFPWSVFLPRTLWKSFRIYWKEPLFLFLLTWFLVQFIFFSFSKAKLPTYILPTFLPLSLLVGRFWQDLVRSLGSKALRIESCVLTLFTIGMLGVGGFFLRKEFPENFDIFLWTSCVILSCILCVLISSFLAKPRWVFQLIAVSFVISVHTALRLLGPSLGQERSMKEFAREIHSRMEDDSPIGSFIKFRPSLVFYLGYRVEILYKIEDLKSFFRRSSNAFCVMGKSDYEGFKSHIPDTVLIKDAAGKVLVTNRDSS
jgi:4-amino-4-deoxy-L-arabinose transferase-like glycosyltransferase